MNRCIFCQMAEKKVASETVYENEEIYAYKDLNPWAPTHIVMFPKTHIGVKQRESAEFSYFRQKLLDAVPVVVEAGGCQDDYELYTEEGEEHLTQNEEHLHFHIRGNLHKQ